jgi:hypothetical protein
MHFRTVNHKQQPKIPRNKQRKYKLEDQNFNTLAMPSRAALLSKCSKEHVACNEGHT